METQPACDALNVGMASFHDCTCLCPGRLTASRGIRGCKSRAVLDDAVVLPEGLRMEVVGVAVLHPGDVVEVAEAGVVLRGWSAIVLPGQ
jgi:hypothetical protein